ncbi:MAG: division/cell wall cluster transcriptional repressor MraZ [Lautropia sp.]
MFEGSYPLTLDAKGRLTIPTEMREQLETLCQGKLTVTRHFGTLLRIYPQPEWERMRALMAERFTPREEPVRRLIIGSADPVQMDGAGRILISPILRKAAKLDKRVVLVGDLQRFEVWDEEVHARYLDEQAEAGIPDAMRDALGF